MRSNIIIWTCALMGIGLASTAQGAEQKGTRRQAYFGDLHLHTGLPVDAYTNGTRKHPVTAYRFAQGDPVMHPNIHRKCILTTPLCGGLIKYVFSSKKRPCEEC